LLQGNDATQSEIYRVIAGSVNGAGDEAELRHFPHAEPPFCVRQTSVEYESLSTKIARLRAELDEIGAANRSYFQRKRHSWDERESHLRRRDRIQQIKAELQAALGKRVLE